MLRLQASTTPKACNYLTKRNHMSTAAAEPNGAQGTQLRLREEPPPDKSEVACADGDGELIRFEEVFRSLLRCGLR